MSLSRVARGAWFTPSDLAEKFASQAVERFFRPFATYDGRPLTVFEPGTGDGALLVAVGREYARRLSLFVPPDRREEAQHYWLREFGRRRLLQGIELDPTSADRTREALVALTGEDRAAEGIRVGDALFEPWPRARLVVANPPYLGGGKISGALGSDYRRRLVDAFPLLKGTANLATCWLQKAIQEGIGHASWILPMACAQGDSRLAGLAPMLASGWVITNATTNIPWPGDAAVNVALVHMQPRERSHSDFLAELGQSHSTQPHL